MCLRVAHKEFQPARGGLATLDASDVDIHHLVPLAEAWDSGAKKWTAHARYANDLGDRSTLLAVTDNVNQSKGARDPPTGSPATADAPSSSSGSR